MRSADTVQRGFLRPSAKLPVELARDIASVERIDSIQGLLAWLCESTGLGFAAVSRVTADSWTACAVHDTIEFGIAKGGQVDVSSTPASQIRTTLQPVAFDHATNDPVYQHHSFAAKFGVDSYISVPIVLDSGEYFGNLGALDVKPTPVSDPTTLRQFQMLAALIAKELQLSRHVESLTTELARARQEAAEREQFIGVLAHDLRSPLATVTALSYSMTRRPESVDAAKVGKLLKTSAGRMSALVEDVLDFSKGRLGKGLTLDLQRDGELASVLSDVIEEARAANPERVIDATVDLPIEASYDKGKLQQLLANLLMNALQHGDPAVSVVVDAKVADGHVLVVVGNVGPPIDPAHLSRMFEPYWRSPTSPSKGLGLGLHICSQVAAAHGGTMTVTSNAEGWTTFTASMPLLH